MDAFVVRELKVIFGKRRRGGTTAAESGTIRTPDAVAALVRPWLEHEPTEVMGVLMLDTRNAVIGWSEVARGGLNAMSAVPRDVFRAAILANANGIVLAHNHPSGDPTPSPDDVAFTTRMKAAGDLIGIALLDHVIIGHNRRYVSFLQQGTL